MNDLSTFPQADGHTHQWAHKPSPFAWSVLVYGGQNPRTGADQPNHEVQFARTRYGTEGILWRANDFAKGEHRTHFAVRGTDGSVIYDGPVMNEIDAPVMIGRLTDDQLVAHSVNQRKFGRDNRRAGGR